MRLGTTTTRRKEEGARHVGSMVRTSGPIAPRRLFCSNHHRRHPMWRALLLLARLVVRVSQIIMLSARALRGRSPLLPPVPHVP